MKKHIKHRPPVTKNCEQCHKDYSCPNYRADKSRFCSSICANLSQRKNERKVITCKGCASKFETVKDHGVWPKFCSKECRNKNAIKPEYKECPSCGETFLAGRSTTAMSDDGRRVYCSDKCRHAGLRKTELKTCPVCGQQFYPIGTEKASQVTCSRECMSSYFTGANSPAYKGGSWVSTTTQHKFVHLDRRGYASPYIAEHRLLASKAIGRLLDRHEFVIHINGDAADNRQENLFICGSNSECGKRRHGSLQWPTKSNLDSYK